MKIFLTMYLLLGLFVAICIVDGYTQRRTKKQPALAVSVAFAILVASWPYWAWRLLK